MATIGDYEDNEDDYLDASIEWITGDKLIQVVEPGYLTVGQCAMLIPALKHHAKGMEPSALEHAFSAYVMLIQRDIAHQEIEVRHPQTLLLYSDYLKMTESGMYGDEARDMPMPDMGWLVSIDEAERWYDAKGFSVDLSKIKADMKALQAGAQVADGDMPTTPSHVENEADLAALFDGVRYESLNKMFPGAGDWKRHAERATRTGLATAARVGRGLFNPLHAALWWLDKNNPPGWDTARVYRTLANNLPPRSSHLKHLLTGNYD